MKELNLDLSFVGAILADGQWIEIEPGSLTVVKMSFKSENQSVGSGGVVWLASRAGDGSDFIVYPEKISALRIKKPQ